MNNILTTLAVVGISFVPRLKAQCILYTGSYTASEIKDCLGDSRTLIIPDSELVQLDGSWDLTDLGPLTIVIEGFGCIIFSGYNRQAEQLNLVQGSSIFIEEGPDNSFALSGTGTANQQRIKLGEQKYRERDFAEIIEAYGVSSVLPIELGYFRGESNSQGVRLEWQTEVEINNAYFEVEHSRNGRDFKAIAYIEGAGTSTRAVKYHFQHKTPVSDINYYRLKQTDFDAAYSYSNIVSVKPTIASTSTVKVFPNPVSEQFSIVFDKAEEIEQVELLSLQGQQLASRWEAGQASYTVPQDLVPGPYVLRVKVGAREFIEKIIIQ